MWYVLPVSVSGISILHMMCVLGTQHISTWPLKRCRWTMRVHKLDSNILFLKINILHSSYPPMLIIQTAYILGGQNIHFFFCNFWIKIMCKCNLFILTTPLCSYAKLVYRKKWWKLRVPGTVNAFTNRFSRNFHVSVTSLLSI